MKMWKVWVTEVKCPYCGSLCSHEFTKKIKIIKSFCGVCSRYFEVEVKIVKSSYNF
ncbi:hypothetical protein M0R19_05590 [Candidatus Pacearchaeota archaeon]|nr:hypothetical protein [Candidatus Pacearchaeota archaeon]